MDFLETAPEFMSFASFLLLMLLNTNRALFLSASTVEGESNDADVEDNLRVPESACSKLDIASRAALNHFRLFCSLGSFDDDLGFWVKPRSTTWFSKFILEEYDDSRWVQMFRMTKRSVFELVELLSPLIKKKDTKYRLAVPVTVRVACTLFKLSHGASLLICFELFAVGRSTISIMLWQVIHAINVGLRNEISWPFVEGLQETATGFFNLCGLPRVMGAIDGTHFAIRKPRIEAPDYFYFKSGGYSITCQAVVDSNKRFLDIYVGMPCSTNDCRVLRRSTLFHRGQCQTLWDGSPTFSGFPPYLLGDAGYPLMPWLMVPHSWVRPLALADSLFNRKLCKGRAVVENAFGLLKQSFRELHQKTELHVNFLPDVILSCAILHNILLKQSHEEVERLLHVLRNENQRPEVNDVDATVDENLDVGHVTDDHPPGHAEGQLKRRDLGVYLSLQRIAPF